MACCRDDDGLMVDSNGCFTCETLPKVKGRFGLAWVSESPDCPCPEPIGWQVEFLDTPSKVEQKCQEMVRWINCPPLPRCDPCPPDELCCPSNPPRCNPCAPKCNPCLPKCPQKCCTCFQPPPPMRSGPQPKPRKKCCCCKCTCRAKRNCYPPMGGPCCRNRSPRRRSPQRCCTCGSDEHELPKCTCDDVPVKDTNQAVNCSSSGTYFNFLNSNCDLYQYVPQQVTRIDSFDECKCTSNSSAHTFNIYNYNSQYITDTDYYNSGNEDRYASPQARNKRYDGAPGRNCNCPNASRNYEDEECNCRVRKRIENENANYDNNRKDYRNYKSEPDYDFSDDYPGRDDDNDKYCTPSTCDILNPNETKIKMTCTRETCSFINAAAETDGVAVEEKTCAVSKKNSGDLDSSIPPSRTSSQKAGMHLEEQKSQTSQKQPAKGKSHSSVKPSHLEDLPETAIPKTGSQQSVVASSTGSQRNTSRSGPASLSHTPLLPNRPSALSPHQSLQNAPDPLVPSDLSPDTSGPVGNITVLGGTPSQSRQLVRPVNQSDKPIVNARQSQFNPRKSQITPQQMQQQQMQQQPPQMQQQPPQMQQQPPQMQQQPPQMQQLPPQMQQEPSQLHRPSTMQRAGQRGPPGQQQSRVIQHSQVFQNNMQQQPSEMKKPSDTQQPSVQQSQYDATSERASKKSLAESANNEDNISASSKSVKSSKLNSMTTSKPIVMMERHKNRWFGSNWFSKRAKNKEGTPNIGEDKMSYDTFKPQW